MSVTIIACPKCKTMLFSDTAACPACQYVFDKSGQSAKSMAPLSPSNVEEERCKNCGEMVRSGLVRCWNCSEFLRDDIAQKYEQMQAAPKKVIYSNLPADVVGSISDNPPRQTLQTEDRDFELSTPRSDTEKREPIEQSVTNDAPEENNSSQEIHKDDKPGKAETQAATDSANDTEPKAKPDIQEPDVDHSVATGGDALLKIALEEEKESKQHRKKSRRKAAPNSPTGILVYCPNGHRLEVQEKHRGLTGRCPQCKAPFFVPEAPKTEKSSDEDAAQQSEETTSSEAAGKFSHWMTDVCVHTVNPERLKLKANSLKNDFRHFDLGFADDQIIAVSFTKRKGSAGAKSKKRLADREKLLSELRDGKTEQDLTATEILTFSPEAIKDVRVVQPAVYAHESMFAGIPVFGEHRIVVRLISDPKEETGKKGEKIQHEPQTLFFSFWLSEFRRFGELMAEKFDIQELGEDCGIPLEDSFKEQKCHYSEETLNVLQNPDYYQADPAYDVQLIGRECEGCGLIVSEDSRKKEKIGGANGKAIAKAICPKCKKKFGTTSLFTLNLPEPEEDSAARKENSESAKAAEK
ncbi:MAG: hypothetical protein Tsb009_18010 [Planctomycetaceae bacterium]